MLFICVCFNDGIGVGTGCGGGGSGGGCGGIVTKGLLTETILLELTLKKYFFINKID